MPTTALPDAVLFDMDGTLVDTEPLWWRAADRVAGRLGLRLGEADAGDVVGRPVGHTARYLVERTGSGEPLPALEEELTGVFGEFIAVGLRPLPGVVPLLARLREAGVPAAVVSASPRRIVDQVLAALGTGWFALTVAAEDTPRTKPAPDPYLAAAHRLGLRPERCLAVEDSVVGVTSAVAAGCHVLAVTAVPLPVPTRAGLSGADLDDLRVPAS